MSQSLKSQRPRVAIIGGGIFGVSTALALAPHFEIVLLERSSDLFRGATFANHGRQHQGFHYPRSPETAQQCLESCHDFRSWYAEAEVEDFPSYYAVAALGSKVDPAQYLRFCDTVGLEFNRAKAPAGIFSEDKLDLCILTREGVLDYEKLAKLARDRIKRETSIQVCTSHEVIGATILRDGKKELQIQGADGLGRAQFDFVVNATYANYNRFCDWLEFPARTFQFNLQELAVIELPDELRLGATIMDGAFPSMIPWGRTPYHLLAHVNASQLIREVSNRAQPLLGRVSSFESNWQNILEASVGYLPILKRARYVKSLFVDRVVDAAASQTDARITDITNHGQGCFSLFAAKVITCVSTAHKISKMILAQA